MAEKKRTAAGKTSSKKTSGSHTAKSKGKRTGKKRRSKKQQQEALVQSLVMFGIGALLIIMLFVPGQSIWLMLRTALFGVFGVGMYLLGAVVIYLAVCRAQGKSMIPEIAKAVIGFVILSGVTAVFSNLDTQELETFWQVVTAYYKDGTNQMIGTGVAGIPIGWLLLWTCGRPAANVIIVVLAICALMVIFGVSPAEIWSTLSYYGNQILDGQKSAIAETKAGYNRRREELLERQQAHQMEREELQDEPDDDIDEEGIFARIGGFFSGLFHGRDEFDYEEEYREEQPEEAPAYTARAISNRRSVMETALRNAEKKAFDVELKPNRMEEATEDELSDDFVEDDKMQDSFVEWDADDAQPYAITPKKGPLEPDFILPDGMRYLAPEPPSKPSPVMHKNVTPEPVKPIVSSVPQPTPSVVVMPHTPDAPGPAKITPEPLDDTSNGEWISIDAQPPVYESAAIDHLTDVAMAKPAVAEQVAATAKAAPAPEQAKPAAYHYPPLSLFNPQKEESEDARAELKANAEKLVSTLDSFGVKTRILDISRGPSVTRYELQPRAGVKISRITSLADDIALNLAVADVRIEAPIPGKPAVGIEVPNRKSTSVAIRSIFESSNYSRMASPLTIALGKDIAGVAQVADLCKMPHLLIAGSTGSGKSVCVNSIIISFIYRSSPEDLKLILIDPKVVELAEYNGIPHLLMPVVTEPRKAAGALCSAVGEMERRYRLFADNNVRDIKTYNKLASETPAMEKLPYIAIIIDELADLMMVAGKEVEDYICRIAQKARAAGMHLIVATQRPSVDVITGLIKANIPSRIAFAVSSQVDSRTILDSAGAEKLLGMGDMLFLPVGASKPVRVQGTYVTDEEITRTLNFIKAEHGAEYDETMIAAMEKAAVENGKSSGGASGGDDTDPMFDECVECVIDAGQASTSFLQRRCKLGYARAARIMDEMEQKGLIGPSEGAKPRAVLISRQQWLEMKLNRDEPVPDEI